MTATVSDPQAHQLDQVMKTLMICMLAVGALAVDTTKKASVNKPAKRGILSVDQGSNIHKDGQQEQELIKYTQPGHQYVVSSGPDSAHTDQVSYQKAVALPAKNQHETEATVVYDDQFRQISHHQVEQGYDHSSNYQGQQVGQEFHGYGGHVSTVSPIGVESHFLRTPVGVSHQVPAEVQHEVSLGAQKSLPVSLPHHDVVLQAVQVPRPLSVEVSRSLEIPVQSLPTSYVIEAHEVQQPIPILVRVPSPLPAHVVHQEPLNIVTGYETGVNHNQNLPVSIDGSFHSLNSLAGHEYSFYRNPVTFGAFEVHPNAGTVVSHEPIDIGTQQHNFAGFENAFPIVYKSVSHEQHVQKPVQVKTTVSDNQQSGYHYDKPTKKFTF